MKLSVALCTYNGEKYIEKQLNSIFNQTMPIDEINICDDGSNDKTIEIINQIQKTYPTIIKLHQNEINLGCTKNFEKAIELCQGDYIFLSDQDDLWKKDKVEKTLAIFDKNPNAEGVFSNAELIDNSDHLISDHTIWDSVFFLEKEFQKPIDYFNIISKNGNFVTGATLCIKKQVKDFIFSFTDPIVLHDEKIATLLILRESLYYSTENLISYRIHQNQQVGMKNMNKIESKKRLKRIILDLEKPATYFEYRHLMKKKYLKYHKAQKYLVFNSSKIDINQLIETSFNEYNAFINSFKKKFPIHYFLSSIVDTLRNKRKL
ncbi:MULTISPECIES: glycosyltransferase [Flavobacterium]|uniref:glycosyltransferase n=1 Tax=Flavobacterium TaxID=237 RepID=UPI0024820D61|nr:MULTISPECIES: glycosyltransferase [Flavobacterium]